MSRQKPDAWLLEIDEPSPLRYVSLSSVRKGDDCFDRTTPLYRRSPTHKEEQAVIRAAVKWRQCQAGDWSGDDALWAAVDRLLAKRKARR